MLPSIRSFLIYMLANLLFRSVSSVSIVALNLFGSWTNECLAAGVRARWSPVPQDQALRPGTTIYLPHVLGLGPSVPALPPLTPVSWEWTLEAQYWPLLPRVMGLGPRDLVLPSHTRIGSWEASATPSPPWGPVLPPAQPWTLGLDAWSIVQGLGYPMSLDIWQWDSSATISLLPNFRTCGETCGLDDTVLWIGSGLGLGVEHPCCGISWGWMSSTGPVWLEPMVEVGVWLGSYVESAYWIGP